jgi:hypothetical protein
MESVKRTLALEPRPSSGRRHWLCQHHTENRGRSDRNYPRDDAYRSYQLRLKAEAEPPVRP